MLHQDDRWLIIEKLGMGRVQESVAEMYLGSKLSWADAPCQTQVNTKSTERVTDSAASATAMATGVTVNNDVISEFLPGSAIFTSLEYYQHLQNKKTAIVTNRDSTCHTCYLCFS